MEFWYLWLEITSQLAYFYIQAPVICRNKNISVYHSIFCGYGLHSALNLFKKYCHWQYNLQLIKKILHWSENQLNFTHFRHLPNEKSNNTLLQHFLYMAVWKLYKNVSNTHPRLAGWKDNKKCQQIIIIMHWRNATFMIHVNPLLDCKKRKKLTFWGTIIVIIIIIIMNGRKIQVPWLEQNNKK